MGIKHAIMKKATQESTIEFIAMAMAIKLDNVPFEAPLYNVKEVIDICIKEWNISLEELKTKPLKSPEKYYERRSILSAFLVLFARAKTSEVAEILNIRGVYVKNMLLSRGWVNLNLNKHKLGDLFKKLCADHQFCLDEILQLLVNEKNGYAPTSSNYLIDLTIEYFSSLTPKELDPLLPLLELRTLHPLGEIFVINPASGRIWVLPGSSTHYSSFLWKIKWAGYIVTDKIALGYFVAKAQQTSAGKVITRTEEYIQKSKEISKQNQERYSELEEYKTSEKNNSLWISFMEAQKLAFDILTPDAVAEHIQSALILAKKEFKKIKIEALFFSTNPGETPYKS